MPVLHVCLIISINKEPYDKVGYLILHFHGYLIFYEFIYFPLILKLSEPYLIHISNRIIVHYFCTWYDLIHMYWFSFSGILVITYILSMWYPNSFQVQNEGLPKTSSKQLYYCSLSLKRIHQTPSEVELIYLMGNCKLWTFIVRNYCKSFSKNHYLDISNDVPLKG